MIGSFNSPKSKGRKGALQVLHPRAHFSNVAGHYLAINVLHHVRIEFKDVRPTLTGGLVEASLSRTSEK